MFTLTSRMLVMDALGAVDPVVLHPSGPGVVAAVSLPILKQKFKQQKGNQSTYIK